jgi:hypothetical protein
MLGRVNPDQRAARIAEAQYGLLATRQARRAGLTQTQVNDRVRDKGWRRPARGLLPLPGAPARSWRQDAMAAVLLGGDRARATHLSSGGLHELCRPSLLPHLSVPRGSSTRTRLAVVHRVEIPPVDRAVVDGIPCSSASRSVVECAGLVDRMWLEDMVDQGIDAGRITPTSVLAALERAGAVRGAAAVRAVVSTRTEDLRPESPAEARFVRRLLEWGAEDVVTQFELRDDCGDFVARFDVAQPSMKQAWEYDSDRFHNPRRFGADERRHERASALGWRVDHVSRVDLLPSATRIPTILAAARSRAEQGLARTSRS